MEARKPQSFESLTDIGTHSRADMRSALLRVLTDLYVQKLTHTLDEERHYTELALRLIETVDVATRAGVAAQLGKHLSPPREVIQQLAGDCPEVAAALRSLPAHTEANGPAGSMFESSLEHAHNRSGWPATASSAATTMSGAMAADIAGELNEIFFAADTSERRLILLNLDIAAPPSAARPRIARDPSLGRRLEAAALARRREDLVHELAQSLLITREQARRIVDDELGEPIVIAAKVLSVPRDLLYRVLLFINTAVGHSVERVHALAQLYDEITLPAAQEMVAIWQAVNKSKAIAGGHQPLLAADRLSARTAPAAQRIVAQARRERRDAS
jgi:hypothetical protein